MTRLLRLEVLLEDAPRLTRLVFEVGFGALQEERSPETPDRVLLSTHSEPGTGAMLERRLLDACSEAGIAVEVSYVELDDAWQTAWADALEPVVVNARLRLVPGAPPPRPSPTDLYLERALAFGYGEHPTTLMALRWLADRVQGRSVLDVGTGTGVLALAAARLGAAHSRGIDIDVPSVLAAQRNARQNDLESCCSFDACPLREVEGTFDVIVANIDALTLRAMAPELCAHLRERGLLSLTGLLREQSEAVVHEFSTLGLQLSRIEQVGDWVLLATPSR